MDTEELKKIQSMSVKEFLAGDYLHRSDIVLVGGGGSLFSRAIRWATKSSFSHAALVFLVPCRDLGFEHTFLIESITSGVDVTNLNHYAVDLQQDRFLAILRLERDWFDEPVQKMVRGRMLNYIKADYDFSMVRSLAAYFFKKTFFGIKARIRGYSKEIEDAKRKNKKIPNEFICSGFVQYGFYSGVQYLIENGTLPAECQDEVFFRSNPDAATADEPFLVSVTPQELSASPKLTWKYVIKKGSVYEVSSEAEGKQILGIKS